MVPRPRLCPKSRLKCPEFSTPAVPASLGSECQEALGNMMSGFKKRLFNTQVNAESMAKSKQNLLSIIHRGEHVE